MTNKILLIIAEKSFFISFTAFFELS